MVEDAVEDDADAALVRRCAQVAKILIGSQNRIDMQVVCRVVAMVAHRFEDGVEVDRRDAHLTQVRKLLFDTLERSTVEVP